MGHSLVTSSYRRQFERCSSLAINSDAIGVDTPTHVFGFVSDVLVGNAPPVSPKRRRLRSKTGPDQPGFLSLRGIGPSLVGNGDGDVGTFTLDVDSLMPSSSLPNVINVSNVTVDPDSHAPRAGTKRSRPLCGEGLGPAFGAAHKKARGHSRYKPDDGPVVQRPWEDSLGHHLLKTAGVIWCCKCGALVTIGNDARYLRERCNGQPPSPQLFRQRDSLRRGLCPYTGRPLGQAILVSGP